MVWFLSGTAGLLILLLFSRIYISISLLYTGQTKSVAVKITLFRFRLFKKTYPIIPENINFPASGFEFESFSSRLESLLETAKLMQQMLVLILKKLKLHRFRWVTEGGTGNAASTGAAAGGLWSMKGMAAGLLGNFTHLKCKPDIRIIPDYQKMYFHCKFDCMVSIQIAQAIHIICKIIRLFFSMKSEKTASA